LGVEAVYVGVAPGYRLEEATQADKTAGAGAEAAEETATDAEAAVGVERRVGRRRGGGEGGGVERRGAAVRSDAVERVLEEVRRVFSGLPVYVCVEEGYVKRTAPMDKRQFKRYLETCRRLGFRFDRRGERWVKPLEELKAA